MSAAELSRKARDAMVSLLKGTADVLASTVEITSETTARTLRGLKGKKAEGPSVAGQTVSDAIDAGSEAGSDLGAVAKGAVIGAVQGVSEVTRVTASVVSSAVQAAVKTTAEAGGDVSGAARKAVEGAIEAGKQAGLRAEEAASAGAAGAIEAAAELGETVASAVARAVSGTVSGVRIVVEAPLGRPTILALGSDGRELELLGQHLKREGYQVRCCLSPQEAVKVARGKQRVSLALVDVSGFDKEIWQACEALRQAKIPFLVITPQRSSTVQKESSCHGASGVLIKPLGVRELVEHIRNLLGE